MIFFKILPGSVYLLLQNLKLYIRSSSCTLAPLVNLKNPPLSAVNNAKIMCFGFQTTKSFIGNIETSMECLNFGFLEYLNFGVYAFLIF